MTSNIEEQFVKASIDLFHDWKKGLKQEEMNERFGELFKIIEKSNALQENISLRDIRDVIGFIVIHLGKSLDDISDEEFIEYIKHSILSTRTYNFFYPIYGLYDFPKNIRLGYSTILKFDDLPKQVQENFISTWGHHFTIDTEYAKTTEEFVKRKKDSTFLHLAVKANGHHKAIEKAYSLAQESVHILRFLYAVHFPVEEYHYIIEDTKSGGGTESVGTAFPGWATYVKGFDKEISELTDILTKSKPTTIERKIRNALRIFGIQTSIINNEVRFVLLVTCLESLLLAGSDRDYILWKLAEKTAFLIGGNRREINDYVRLAYNKRSAFIHGETKKKKDEVITECDVRTMEGIVVAVFRKLMKFREQGYVEVQKKKDAKNVEEYIEEIKFGKNTRCSTITIP